MKNTTQNSATVELVESLLNEHYAAKNDFGNMNLEAVGSIIEEARNNYEHPDSLTPEFLAEMESFERCKSIYCLLLLEFELEGMSTVPVEKLSQLKEGQQASIPFTADEEDSMSEKTMISMGISGALIGKVEEFKSSHCDETSDYLKFANFLERTIHTKDMKFPPPLLSRFQAQSMCFAIESEISSRFSPYIRSFWGNKNESIQSILDGKNHGVELHPDLKKGLEEIAKNHPHWLSEGKYPLAGTINSLKYISSVHEIEKFKPAPLDTAVLLLFFGHSGELGSFELQNQLFLSGLLQKEVIELAFRLTRVQKIKSKILTISNIFVDSDLHLLQEDTKAILSLLGKTSDAKAVNLQNVA